MSILDKIFVYDDEKPKQVERKENVFIPTPVVIPESNLSKFTEHFDELFKRQNLPGPDYFEFNKMSSAMPSTMSSEDKAQACFAALNAQGLSKEKLLGAADHYLQAIREDKTNFLKAIDDNVKSEIDGKKNQLEAISKENDRKRLEIEKLQTEINDSIVQVAKLKTAITSDTERIEINKASYESACNSMIDRIVKDIEIIKTI